MTTTSLSRNEKRTVSALVSAGAPVYISGIKHKLTRDHGSRKMKALENLQTGEIVEMECQKYCELIGDQYITFPKFLPLEEDAMLASFALAHTLSTTTRSATKQKLKTG